MPKITCHHDVDVSTFHYSERAKIWRTSIQFAAGKPLATPKYHKRDEFSTNPADAKRRYFGMRAPFSLITNLQRSGKAFARPKSPRPWSAFANLSDRCRKQVRQSNRRYLKACFNPPIPPMSMLVCVSPCLWWPGGRSYRKKVRPCIYEKKKRIQH